MTRTVADFKSYLVMVTGTTFERFIERSPAHHEFGREVEELITRKQENQPGKGTGMAIQFSHDEWEKLDRKFRALPKPVERIEVHRFSRALA